MERVWEYEHFGRVRGGLGFGNGVGEVLFEHREWCRCLQFHFQIERLRLAEFNLLCMPYLHSLRCQEQGTIDGSSNNHKRAPVASVVTFSTSNFRAMTDLSFSSFRLLTEKSPVDFHMIIRFQSNPLHTTCTLNNPPSINQSRTIAYDFIIAHQST